MTFSVYVAGPLFSEAERRFLELIYNDLAGRVPIDVRIDLPHRLCNNTPGVFECDMTYLRDADVVLAWLDGSDVDSGTAFEIGYAYSKGKLIVGYITDKRFNGENINKMIYGACSNGDLIFDSLNDVANMIVQLYNRKREDES